MDRIGKLMDVLKPLEVEAVLVQEPSNRYYLSGFTGSAGSLLLAGGERFLVTDFRYLEQAAEECLGIQVWDQGREGPYAAIAKILEQKGIGRLGFEEDMVTWRAWKRMEEAMPRTTLVPVSEQILRLRTRKDPEEIEKIGKAAKLGDLAFAHILGELRPGVSELEVALEIECFLRRNGAQKLSFDTIAASGPRSSLPHAQPTERKLVQGDFLTLDFGCVLDHYCSDMTRTVVLGKADVRQKEIYGVVRQAQETALSGIRPGMTGKEADALARDVIEAAGWGKMFGHGLGHGLGLEVHESPRFSPNDSTVIQENMVMTVEPGIYVPGFGGVRIEDLVVVVKDGVLNMTGSPKELMEL
ncbi:M24 family metallopeptidase [Anaerotalea alkaliphila]|uniref:Aminopeptidase P family protein n=1 Tax=Anaerotalea alkaliphila TaxID=2662126 RepID=A0A7X5HTQ9_9FIRM|nr:Xaa-Pro peptidase family protein [Anaerotalea alkaliphila]NDL66251.1 aminopeptidase P family protein [Anaerotalea alkaliphila]